MTRLWLVRHGPTHAKRLVGWTDLPADLSDVAAVARLSAALPQAPIVSSDLIRAVATADAVATGRPRLPHDADLREMHFGGWEDRAPGEIDDPDLRAFFDDPGDRRAPDGESWNDTASRVRAAVARLAGPEDLIVVAHMGAILTLWAEASELLPYDALAQSIDNLSVTRIDIEADRLVPRSVNVVA